MISKVTNACSCVSVKVDADGSGELDFDEFARAFGGLSEAQNTGFYSNVELLRRLFDELDDDRTATISRDEILEKMHCRSL